MKRRLLAIAIFLLAGAAVNVAVAWGCLNWSATEDGELASATRSDRRWWQRHAPTAFEGTPSEVNRSEGFGITAITRGAGETYYEHHGGIPAVVYRWVVAQELRGGWPARTITGERWTRSDAMMGPSVREEKTVYRWSRSLGPAVLSSDDVHAWRLMPMRPLLLGLAINTLVYATLLWLLAGGAFALRRFVRVRRGLCPTCGYDLRHGEHEACPECGVTA